MLVYNWLKTPYFFINSPKFNFILSFGVGLFIFLFLFSFQPFGIASILNNKFLYTGGFGLVSFIAMVFFFVGLPFFFKNYFKDENWNVGKNIFFLFCLLVTITLANYYYNSLVQNTENMYQISLSNFFVYTFSLAIFPILLFTFISEKLYRIHRKKTAKKIMLFKNAALEKKIKDVIHIYGDNKKENITFHINDLIYITSQGNYAIFYLKSEKGIKKSILRNTLSHIFSKLKNYPNIIRCHKSYIVNSEFINTVSGNARGYYLESDVLTNLIPVSRSFKKEELQNLIC